MNYVKIGERNLPVQFGMGALRQFEKSTGKNAMQLFQNKEEMSFSDMIEMVYSAFVCGCRRDKRNVDFTVDDVADWVDDDLSLIETVFKEAEAAMNAPVKKAQGPAQEE